MKDRPPIAWRLTGVSFLGFCAYN